MTTWGEYVERLARGATAKSIAARVGVDSSQVSRWKSGQVPTAENAIRFAEEFGGDPGEALVAAGHATAVPTKQSSEGELPNSPTRIEHPYLHLFTLLWTNARQMAEVALESEQSADFLHQLRYLLAITVDVASDLLVAGPDAAVSKPLLQQMFEEFYGLRSVIDQREEDLNHDLEAEAEPDASSEANEIKEAKLSGDAEREDVALTVDEVAPAVEDVGVDSQDGQAFGQ